ncbi:hypothetical protein [Bacteroides sp.]|uniref:hypothetical protein n=1 Tax=Bacteroides TaxID=816 RepID=UPI0025C38106|nr:hypothetical protein [Bacteroides sp.]
MNRLLTFEGGQPFALEDIDFLQDALTEVISGLASTYGNFILSGCKLSVAGDKVTWTAGYIVIDQQVYHVEAGSIIAPSTDNLYWKVITTDSQSVVFEDGSQNKIYRRSKASIVSSVDSSDTYVPANGVKTANDYFMSYEKENLLYQVTTPKNMATVERLKNNQGINICKITFSVPEEVTQSGNVLFSYTANPMFGLSTPIVYGGALYALRLANGAAYIYDMNGNPVKTLKTGSFSVNVLI